MISVICSQQTATAATRWQAKASELTRVRNRVRSLGGGSVVHIYDTVSLCMICQTLAVKIGWRIMKIKFKPNLARPQGARGAKATRSSHKGGATNEEQKSNEEDTLSEKPTGLFCGLFSWYDFIESHAK